MYGFFPEKPANLAFKVERVDPKALGGKATLKEITNLLRPGGHAEDAPPARHPQQRTGPAPVSSAFNFPGNHAVLADRRSACRSAGSAARARGVKDNKATDEGRGAAIENWSIEQTIDAGYAVATFYAGDVEPARGNPPRQARCAPVVVGSWPERMWASHASRLFPCGRARRRRRRRWRPRSRRRWSARSTSFRWRRRGPHRSPCCL